MSATSSMQPDRATEAARPRRLARTFAMGTRHLHHHPHPRRSHRHARSSVVFPFDGLALNVSPSALRVSGARSRATPGWVESPMFPRRCSRLELDIRKIESTSCAAAWSGLRRATL